MAGFSIQEVALGGFAAVRAHPRALLVWTPFAFAVSLIAEVVFVQAGGQTVDWSVLGEDPAKVSALLQKVAPAELALLLMAVVTNAFVQAAMMRLVFSPGAARFGFFRIGADELRQLGLEILALVVLMGGYFGFAVVASIIMVAISGLGAPTNVAGLIAGVSAALVVLAAVFVRLSLAVPLTFDTGRINLFGSWRLTRGQFWPILGTYILVIALVAAVWVFANVLFFGLAEFVLGRDMPALMGPPQNVAGSFTPMRLIAALFSAFVTALIWPVLLTPPARIYRSLKQPSPVRFGAGPQPWA
ncbi:MAG TPA: hypothetical protein VGH03_21620 [Caulobacteraceae bacterium]|jgi:hypothetical protein